MTVPQETDDWRKPSASQDEGACFLVRRDLAALQDTKNLGPILALPLDRLVTMVQTDQITR